MCSEMCALSLSLSLSLSAVGLCGMNTMWDTKGAQHRGKSVNLHLSVCVLV